MGETYDGMSSKHLVTNAKEALNLNNSGKNAAKNRLQQCKSCSKSKISLHSSFMIFKEMFI